MHQGIYFSLPDLKKTAAMAIALADVGKSVREILYGTPKEGTFNYDQKVVYSTKTADGVVRATAAKAAAASVDQSPLCSTREDFCIFINIHCISKSWRAMRFFLSQQQKPGPTTDDPAQQQQPMLISIM